MSDVEKVYANPLGFGQSFRVNLHEKVRKLGAVRPRKARPVAFSPSIKIPAWADEKARDIAHDKGWDYHVLRSNWLSFAQDSAANGNAPENAGAACIGYCKKQEKLR